jgi:parallel beta-helix repeat protein
MALLLFLSLFVLAFTVQPAKALSGAIFINPDGSISSPVTANITTFDNVTYTFTNNNYEPIVVQRSSITIDGAGYALSGPSSGNGVFLSGINNVTIKNTTISDFNNGILLTNSSANNISGNNMTNNNDYGLCLSLSSGNTVLENNITSSKQCGIMLTSSSGNLISGNGITDDWQGVFLESSSSYNTISGNRLTANNEWGIYLDSSSNHDTIADNSITDGKNGVTLDSTSGSSVTDNNISTSIDGIDLYSSSNNTISHDNITANIDPGIWLDNSSSNTVLSNDITNNGYGIALDLSHNNSISANVFVNDGLTILSYSFGNIVSDNLVNGKPLVYLEDATGKTVTDAGQVVLVNCTRITVKNLDLSNTDCGVELWNANYTRISDDNITNTRGGLTLYWSSNNSITCNNIASNELSGLYLDSSSGNIISGNNIASNILQGVFLYNSSDNRFYHNNFIDNGKTAQVYAGGSMNVWDDGYPSGGNYWSDYRARYPDAAENGSSGIWNMPYFIDANNVDRYPLLEAYSLVALLVSISPSSATLEVGQSMLFTSSVSLGTAPYTYQWYLDGSAVSGATSSTWTYTPSAVGSHTIYVIVTDNVGSHAQSDTVRVLVGYLLTLSANVTAPNLTFTIDGKTYSGSASVILSPGNYTITASTQVLIKRNRLYSAYYYFVEWSGFSTQTGATITIDLTANTSLIACYAVELAGRIIPE